MVYVCVCALSWLQNGNHVIQKIIECVPTVRISALLDNFLPCVVQLSSHPFGCRVMQRILEHCNDDVRRVRTAELDIALCATILPPSRISAFLLCSASIDTVVRLSNVCVCVCVCVCRVS